MKSWPHAPARIAVHPGAIMVTASTFHKVHHFAGDERLELLQSSIFKYSEMHRFELQAWAVFPNHYHFIALAPENPNLKAFLKCIHGYTGNEINKVDLQKGRQVWYRYWDSQLTFEKSYLARLHYIHHNPVKHGLVHHAEHYRFCSMAWFQEKAHPPFRDTVLSFPIDNINVYDDF